MAKGRLVWAMQKTSLAVVWKSKGSLIGSRCASGQTFALAKEAASHSQKLCGIFLAGGGETRTVAELFGLCHISWRTFKRNNLSLF